MGIVKRMAKAAIEKVEGLVDSAHREKMTASFLVEVARLRIETSTDVEEEGRFKLVSVEDDYAPARVEEFHIVYPGDGGFSVMGRTFAGCPREIGAAGSCLGEMKWWIETVEAVRRLRNNPPQSWDALDSVGRPYIRIGGGGIRALGDADIFRNSGTSKRYDSRLGDIVHLMDEQCAEDSVLALLRGMRESDPAPWCEIMRMGNAFAASPSFRAAPMIEMWELANRVGTASATRALRKMAEESIPKQS